MATRPELLVRGADGRPLPPSDVLDRIRRYDARLGLFYTNASWAITEAWRDDDKRREWVQKGEVQPEYAFDICGYLPVNCSVADAPGYIERALRSYKPEEYRALRDAVRDWNTFGIDKQHEEELRSHVEEDMTKTGPSLGIFAVPSGAGTGEIHDTAAAPDPAIAAAMASRRRKK